MEGTGSDPSPMISNGYFYPLILLYNLNRDQFFKTTALVLTNGSSVLVSGRGNEGRETKLREV